MMRRAALLALTLFAMPAWAEDAPLLAVTAQSQYGDLVQQLAGPRAGVFSVPIGPNQDPHSFEPGPSVARTLAEARIVVQNGLDYDPWMTKLLAATQTPDRIVIVVGDVLHRRPTDNPHLWFDPAGIPIVARAITAALTAADPAGRAAFQKRLQAVIASLAPLESRIAALRARYAGVPVTATEPVFGLMTAAIGLQMRNERFQVAVMNETEPRASDVAAFETDLRQRRVRVLIFNSQTTGGSAERLRALAGRSGIPVAAVTETMPAGMHYQDWIAGQLDGLEAALALAPP